MDPLHSDGVEGGDITTEADTQKFAAEDQDQDPRTVIVFNIDSCFPAGSFQR